LDAISGRSAVYPVAAQIQEHEAELPTAEHLSAI
jgi:hypothetical protein